MGEISFLIVGLVMGWFSVAFGIIIYIQVRRWWRKRRYGESIDHSLLLVEYGRKLTNAANHADLAQTLTQELPAELDVRQSVLLLPKDHQLITIGQGDLMLPINHAAVRWISSSGEAQRSDQGRLRELIEQGRADLTWTQVWVPLMRGAHLEGIWLLGDRDVDLHYSPEDLRWLTSLSREAASVLVAMRFTEKERQAAAEMRALYRQVIAAREKEHGRLSRELHDGVLQDLCAITRDLKAITTSSEYGDGSYSNLVKLSSETVQALRAICNDLRPPLLQQDLISTLRALVQEFDARSPTPVYIEFSIQQNELALSEDIALAIFRITQEALNNALQHSDASEVAVRLTEYPDRLRLTITDDGQGIAGRLDSADFVTDGHYGIAGMRERATMIGGSLDLQSSSGYGTVVIFELPYEEPAQKTVHPTKLDDM